MEQRLTELNSQRQYEEEAERLGKEALAEDWKEESKRLAARLRLKNKTGARRQLCCC